MRLLPPGGTRSSTRSRRSKRFERHQRSVELAEPLLRKYKVKLAIENHKGWRAAEHVAWIRRLGSEWVGACYDFGNNMALCEDPAETLRLLAPVTIHVSFKDMAVAPYDEGFLLSEMGTDPRHRPHHSAEDAADEDDGALAVVLLRILLSGFNVLACEIAFHQ